MQEDMYTQPLDESRLVFTFTRYPNPSRLLFVFKWLFSISGFASSEASSFWHIWPQLGNVPALQQNNKLLRNERLRYIFCETERSYSLKILKILCQFVPWECDCIIEIPSSSDQGGPGSFSLHT